jgi:hypothetical protein
MYSDHISSERRRLISDSIYSGSVVSIGLVESVESTGWAHESGDDCACRCDAVYAQLSDNLGWRRHQEMSDKNNANETRYVSAV